ncbi:DUF4158 domain-containing protein [Nocardia araoensis]|uniref:DUF4158 domain-containing protein n=1 Tax=Nocardia araoensis TaxID=228600 RepID=UPI000303B89A|nr:DUF4158 domain-containing protein [Nocardia araoensis]
MIIRTRSFADIEGELVAWIADQAWTTGDGPKVLTAGSVRWLREKGVLLPGITTLERLVAETKQAADQRLWSHLAGQLSAGQPGVLLGLLETREENRRKYVELERLRKGAFVPSSTGMRNALARVRDLNAVIPASVDISQVSARRLIALASHGLTGKTAHLRRMHAAGTVAGVAVCDGVHVARQGGRRCARVVRPADGDEPDGAGGTAVQGGEVAPVPADEPQHRQARAGGAGALEMTETEPELSLQLVWDLIENTVSKAELAAAVAAIDELVPQADPEFDCQRLEELAGRFATVRAFLPAMMRHIDFGAVGDGLPVLKAMRELTELIASQRGRRLSTATSSPSIEMAGPARASAVGDGVGTGPRRRLERLGDDTPASVDKDGKLHVAALAALPDPPSRSPMWPASVPGRHAQAAAVRRPG